MQGLCCVRDVEGGLQHIRRAALQEEPNAMLFYAQVLDEGVYLQKSSNSAAFYLNRTIIAISDAKDGSLDHLKVYFSFFISHAKAHLFILLFHIASDKKPWTSRKIMAWSRCDAHILQDMAAPHSGSYRCRRR